MNLPLPPTWQTVLHEEIGQPYFQKLREFVDEERQHHQVFPPEDKVFNALKTTRFDEVKVVLLGQDPYHDEGQAMGLCFSVPSGVKPPPSLVNIFKELKSDVGVPIPRNGDLTPWARQGVLLLNTVLTVRAHQAHSHRKKGWEKFTDTIIQKLSDRPDPIVFLLWGRPAQTKEPLIQHPPHFIFKSAHPSPLSARTGFFGSRPFSQTNEMLKSVGKEPIDWRLE